MQSQHKPARARRWVLLLIAVLALGAAVFALWKSGWLERINSVDALRAWIDDAGPMASVVYFLLQMMTVIIAPIPSNVTMMAGALALGFAEAAILGVAAVFAGSLIMFTLARRLGRNAMQRFLDRGVMEKYMPLIEEKQEMFLFLSMLFPFFPDDALCILAGLSSIRAGTFACIVALGRPWGLIFAALLGGGVIQMPAWAWVVLTAVMAAIFFFSMKYSRQIETALLAFVRKIVPSKGEKR